jgi:hypothetical protein
MRRPLAAAALAAGALLAAPAVAQIPGDAVSVNPATAGKGSHLIIDFHASEDPQANGRSAQSVVLAAATGFKFDPRARSETCSADRAKANNCPASSRIGSGTAQATVSNGAISQPVTADVGIFLAPPPKAGDAGGVVLAIKERSSGAQGHLTGRVVKTGGGQFGLEVRFDDLSSANSAAPQGFTVRIDRLQAEVGTSRTEKITKHKTVKKNGKKKKVAYKVKVVRDLIRNPTSCSGSWPYQVRLRYSATDGSVRDGTIACSG